jgi:cell division protein FtsB
VIPELVFTNEVDGYKGINYAEVSAVLVEAIKEQQKQIEDQQKEINELKALVSRLADN